MTPEQRQRLEDAIADYGDAERVLGIRGHGVEVMALEEERRAQQRWEYVTELLRDATR